YSDQFGRSPNSAFDDISIQNDFRAYSLDSRDGFFYGFYVQHSKSWRKFGLFRPRTSTACLYFFLNLFHNWFNDDIVNTYQFDLFKDFLLGSIANGEHGDYSCHPKNNPKCSQQRPQPIGDYRFKCDIKIC